MSRFGTILDAFDTITEAVSGRLKRREPEEFGPVKLSIQAGRTMYCEPRADLPDLSDYTSVEVGFIYNGHLARPSMAGIEGFDDLFEDGGSPVAGCVSIAKVGELREAIRAKYANT